MTNKNKSESKIDKQIRLILKFYGMPEDHEDYEKHKEQVKQLFLDKTI